MKGPSRKETGPAAQVPSDPAQACLEAVGLLGDVEPAARTQLLAAPGVSASARRPGNRSTTGRTAELPRDLACYVSAPPPPATAALTRGTGGPTSQTGDIRTHDGAEQAPDNEVEEDDLE
ncbi:hypothetical protein TUSST3_40420 [Streptomyces sp. TUS-ST3]|nr:hypothetical protein TUSST3_40420 [Streptomyces sp. TUS-ST3]